MLAYVNLLHNLLSLYTHPLLPSPCLVHCQALGVRDVLSFEFVSPPPRDALVAALEQLLSIGALDNTGALSSAGALMSKMPLEPSYSKALLAASVSDCLSPMLSLIAMLSVEGAAFITPHASQRGKKGLKGESARELADEARRRFSCAQADTITLVNVFAAFAGRQGAQAKAWCDQHYVNRRTMESAVQVRSQLRETCERLQLLSSGFSEREAAEAEEAKRRSQLGVPIVDQDTSRTLRRCLTSAFFLNAAQRQPSGEYLALTSKQTVAIHPSSSLFQRRVQCVLFNELLFTTKLYMRELTQIEAEWLPELAPQVFQAQAIAAAGKGGEGGKGQRLVDDPALRQGGAGRARAVQEAMPRHANGLPNPAAFRR